ncbi:unnamed protein product [Fusarium graminearum]|uniref:Uncharacterized protein n=1 Tax=Gibberella zeae TaxID=5518 RepID=A0A4U9EIC3_GIBZA|nr:unnamed protein product [Fusarium graminearum]VTO82635.1 unnamed protein product [Fusarium graminearum]
MGQLNKGDDGRRNGADIATRDARSAWSNIFSSCAIVLTVLCLMLGTGLERYSLRISLWHQGVFNTPVGSKISATEGYGRLK